MNIYLPCTDLLLDMEQCKSHQFLFYNPIWTLFTGGQTISR